MYFPNWSILSYDPGGNEMERDESGAIFVEIKPVTVSITPVMQSFHAEQFLKAAQVISQDRHIPRGAPTFSPVPYYLYCRALELILKAYLSVRGLSSDSLKKKYGHDLERLWNDAVANDLLDRLTHQSTELPRDIALANQYYAPPAKAFEYFDFRRWANNYPDLPSLDRFGSDVTSLIHDLGRWCRDQS